MKRPARMPEVEVRPLSAVEAAHHLADLAELLVDAVEHGASVNFLDGLTTARARQFWDGVLPGLEAGSTRLLVAKQDGRIVGTALLFLAGQPNQPHRGDIGKMLVHSSLRRRGLGRRLLDAAEALAQRESRTLLMLDTSSGSAGEALYREAGWTAYGRVPGHALDTAGVPSETTFFFKQLG